MEWVIVPSMGARARVGLRSSMFSGRTWLLTLLVGLVWCIPAHARVPVNSVPAALMTRYSKDFPAPSGLVRAETLFDRGEFLRAARVYQGLGTELARYKLAWCWIRLTRYSDATRELLGLVREARDEVVGLDAARDLATVLVGTLDEREVLSIYDREMGANRLEQVAHWARAEVFLKRASRLIRERSGPGPIEKKLESFKADLELRVDALVAGGLSTSGLQLLHGLLEQMSPAAKVRFLALSETEAERLWKQFKARRWVTDAARLVEFLASHLRSFGNEGTAARHYSQWFAACEQSGDDRCIRAVGERVVSTPALGVLHDRALDLLIESSARLRALDRGRYGPGLRKALAIKLASMDRARAVQAGLRLAEVEQEDLDWASAVRTLVRVLRIEPSPGNWVRLKRAEFQAGEFGAVFHAPGSYGVWIDLQAHPEVDSDLSQVEAEASYALGRRAMEAGRWDEMGVHFARFERRASNAARVTEVRDQWLRSLLDARQWQDAMRKFSDFPAQWRVRNDAVAMARELEGALLDDGQFELMRDWVQLWPGHSLLAEVVAHGTSIRSAERLTRGELNAAVWGDPSWILKAGATRWHVLARALLSRDPPPVENDSPELASVRSRLKAAEEARVSARGRLAVGADDSSEVRELNLRILSLQKEEASALKQQLAQRSARELVPPDEPALDSPAVQGLVRLTRGGRFWAALLELARIRSRERVSPQERWKLWCWIVLERQRQLGLPDRTVLLRLMKSFSE